MQAEPLLKPAGCSNFKLRQLTRRVSQHFDRELGKAGLRTTQYSLLSHVARLGPLRPGDLAQAMSLDPSTLTRNLKPLVAHGWIVVGRGADARSLEVAITQAGREKRDEAKRRWKAAQESLNRLLGVEQIIALHDLIDRSIDRLTQPRISGDG
jgi:DNA-binding MarR family transcriptional regulator